MEKLETIVINTLDTDTCEDYLKVIPADKLGDYEVVNTANMNIKHCVGCNLCWLKAPGICAIKDDYEQILRKIAHARNLWIIADTHFGFPSSCVPS